MGVFLICCTKSKALARVSLPVFWPRMISTRGMRSTGEKKCRPIKLCGRADCSAKPVIGRVDVLEAKIAVLAICASASRVTLPFNLRSSKTASIIKSHPFRSSAFWVVEIRFKTSACFSGVIRPWPRRFSNSLTAYCFPFSAVSLEISLRTTSTPASAAT